MKILFFSPFYDPHIGGVENYAKELNENLSSKEIGIVVFTPQIPIRGSLFEKNENIEIIRFPAFEIIHNYPFPKIWSSLFWKQFISLFKREDLNLVVSYTRFFNTSLLALFFSRFKKIRWIHVEHGSDFSKINNILLKNIPKLYDYSFGRLVLRSANVSLAVSEAAADFVKKLSGIEAQVIYRGFDKQKFDSILANQEIRREHSDKIIITYIGRLIEGKGVINLIKAIERINSDKIICLIIGNGPELSKFQKYIAENKLEKKIFLLGSKQFEDAIAILKSSDIFVNPSYTEGLPTSVIEAGFCGKSIIATNAGGTNEIMTGDRDGFLINPGDIEELKEKIVFFLENPEKIEEFGKKAREEVSSKFTWDKQIEEFIKIFKENADGK